MRSFCYLCNEKKQKTPEMRTVFIIIFSVLSLLFLSQCSVRKYIPENETLLRRYVIKYDSTKNKLISTSDLRGYLKPNPNKRFLWTYYGISIYYNAQRKPTKFRKWLNRKFGEEPVYLKDLDIERQKSKMTRFLTNSGFFNAQIEHEIIYSKKKKADVVYSVHPGKPYTVDSLYYQIQDSLIKNFVLKEKAESLIKKGDVFNAYTLDDERSRITNILKNNGYYFFTPNYVTYEVDSNFNQHIVWIKTVINDIKIPDETKLGSFVYKPHIRYFLDTIYITPDYDPVKYPVYKPHLHTIDFIGDSIYPYIYYCHPPKHRFNIKTFDPAIKLKTGKPYRLSDVQETYRKLFMFPVIRNTNITFDTVPYNDSLQRHYMHANVKMQTGKLNYFGVEGVLTNSSGDPGIRGNIIIANKNAFKRAEVFRVRMNGGFEMQTVFDSTGNSSWFNTFEAGMDLSLTFPRFFSPIKFKHFSQKYNPTTTFNLGFNFQKRPNYDRNSTNITFSYSWKKGDKLHFFLTPFVLNFVNIYPTPEFEEILEEETNQRLKEQYSDHFILGVSASIVYDNQKLKKSRNFDYIRLDFESSGNLLYGFQSMFQARTNPDGFYQLFGVPYSQYFKIRADYRHYYHFSESDNVLAFRILTGTAIPYLNSNEIPYEKGFYACGANDMRGWKLRTLGPGSYQGGNEDFERIGDIQLETNIEYRFTIYDWFKGAFFVDAGNIWTYSNTNYPGGEFKINEFYKQIAMDMGTGVRFDFTYFIFRLDAGIPFRDPGYPEGYVWRFKYWHFRDFVLNFGIGYPF
jgi:outer membrane protein assembly factor BamA